jgi:hypothetical protein
MVPRDNQQDARGLTLRAALSEYEACAPCRV